MTKYSTNIESRTDQKSPCGGFRGLGLLQEIFASLKHNKLRTALTGFAVAWGIFILIVLLGAGNGLRNGVMSNFGDRTVNFVYLFSGQTSMPYKGLKAGREMPFSEKELKIIENLPETDKLSGVINVRNQTISYGAEYGSYGIDGVQPAYAQVNSVKIMKGRFINELDVIQQKKVVVLDHQVEQALFKGESSLGKFVKIGSLMYRVVGVRDNPNHWTNVYLPFSTAQAIYSPNKKFPYINFSINGLKTAEENEAFNQRVKEKLSKSMEFHPDDPNAIWIWNAQKNYIETQKILGAINIFVGIIGIFTLIAGIVGISNIMLVSVKERTREFGIRKALGAQPASILWSVILEAVMITAIFGYIGLVCGVGLTEAVNWILSQNADPNGMTIFKNPTISLNYAFSATLIMIIAGVIAGYIPARKAVKIKPIEAMKE